MLNKNRLLCVAASIFFFACSNNKDQKETTNETVVEKNAETNTPAINNGEVKADINVTITGGDLNGTYSANCTEGCCSWGIAGENTFGNQFSVTGKGPKELSSVQLVVNDVKDGSKTTKEFTVTIGFGEFMTETYKSFDINTRNGYTEGSGTLDLQYSGDKAIVTVKGVSKQGPAIDLKLECKKVLTNKEFGM